MQNVDQLDNAADRQAAIAKSQAAVAATDQAGWSAALPGIEADIADNNFAAAFHTAETTDNSATNDSHTTTNPLLEMLETSQGLKELDPSKNWTQAETQQYYAAFTDPSVYNANMLGQNPYGKWGDPTKAAQDAATDWTTDKGAAPNVVQFAGQTMPASFLDKYGTDLAALALTVATAGVGAEAGAALVAATGAESAAAVTGAEIGGAALAGSGIGAAEGAITGGNIGEDALLGGLSGGAAAGTAPLASEVGSVTGLGSTASGALAGGAIRAGVGAVGAEVTGGNVGEAAEIGGASGAISGAIQGSGAASAAKSGIGSALGSQTAGNILGGAVTGLTTGALTSLATKSITSPTGKGASSANTASTSTPAAVTAPAKKTTEEVSRTAAETTLSPGVSPAKSAATNPAVTATTKQEPTNMAAASALPAGVDQSGINNPLTIAPESTSVLGDFGSGVSSGLASTLGTGSGSSLASSLGSFVGSAAPYAAVGAIGLEQAKAGQAQDAAAANTQKALAQPALNEATTLQNNYNSGTISPTDEAVVNTEVAQGNQIIQSATGLSQIAQAAFQSYQSGKLEPAQQLQLDQSVAAQKQGVAQQLASAGITDSTILAAQYQQIDNNAIITKQNLLNSNFDTGSAAYNQWLTSTTQGQQTIQDGMKYASTSLQTELANSMSESNIGINEMNSAIQLQMTTDANYANQVSTLMGTLATAYAKQVAGQKANSSGNAAGNAGSAAAGAAKSAAGGTAGSGGTVNGANDPGNTGGVTGNVQGSAEDQLQNNTDINSAIQGNMITDNQDLLNSIQTNVDTDDSIWGDLGVDGDGG